MVRGGVFLKLAETSLFKNTSIDDKRVVTRTFSPGNIIETEGTLSTYIGVVLEGTVQVITYTIQGTPILMNTISQGMIFGDVLIYSQKHSSYPGNIISKTNTTIAIIPKELVEQYIQTNPMFLHNYLAILSNKVYQGSITSKLLSQDSIRDKILFFLAQEKIEQKSNTILLHQTKEELAKVLHVTRPSLSRELSNMKKEGLIDYDKYTITVKHRPIYNKKLTKKV
jgi:CRP-like cAMP-binding protein